MKTYSFYRLPPSKRKHKIPPVFYPASIVPISDRFIFTAPLQPGPGRYSPDEIACPCRCGHTYDIEQHRKFEHQNRKQFYKRTKIRRIAYGNLCDPPKIRNIPYHGNTSVFKSKVIRLTAPKIVTQSGTTVRPNVERPMSLDKKYIEMVLQPKRNPISYPEIDFSPQPSKLRFNSTERSMKRTKLRSNKRVAFMSGCSRFKHLTAIAKEDFEKKISPNMPVIRPFKVRCDASRANELRKLPRRLEMLRRRKEVVDKVLSFQPIPSATILVDESLFRPTKSLEKINKTFKLEQFFKDEYTDDN